MTSEQLTRWGERYGLSLRNVRQLQSRLRQHQAIQERVCNGDPHPSVIDRTDKNANARAWEKHCDRIDADLEKLAASLGFQVDYGVGLYPALVWTNGDNSHVMVP